MQSIHTASNDDKSNRIVATPSTSVTQLDGATLRYGTAIESDPYTTGNTMECD